MANRIKHFGAHLIRWAIAGLMYMGIEVAWRGYSHWTMGVLAFFLAIPLDIANDCMEWHEPLLKQAFLGMLTVTAAEFLAGCILNLWLGLGIWDYSSMPLNLLGQVCVPYMALWFLLCIPVIVVFDHLEWKLCGGEKPTYKFF